MAINAQTAPVDCVGAAPHRLHRDSKIDCHPFLCAEIEVNCWIISMHHFHGHSLIDTKWVIQSHIAAMFMPSFIAPLLFRYLDTRAMMLLGLVCYCATIVIGFADTSVSGFWLQLVLLGVGWNFLFVAGTSLLPSTHSASDRFKVQAMNDFMVFSLQSVAALSAGWVINLISWQQMLLGCLIPITLMLGVLVWERIKTQQIAASRH